MSKYFLRVGRKTVSTGFTEDVNSEYALSPAGVPIDAIDLTWVGQLGFLAYLVSCLVARGRTLGMRLLRIRLTVLPPGAHPAGVPIKLLLIRAGVALGGFVPAALAVALALALPHGGATGPLIIAAVLLGLLWVGINVVAIARRDDSIYDALAGLAVLEDHAWLGP